MIRASYKIVTRIDGMGQGIINFHAGNLGYLVRKPNITQVPYIEIVKGHWKPVIFTESDGNLVLFEI